MRAFTDTHGIGEYLNVMQHLVSLATQENLSDGIGEYLNVTQHFILLVSLATEENMRNGIDE